MDPEQFPSPADAPADSASAQQLEITMDNPGASASAIAPEPAGPVVPAEGSDAAASLEFGRNLTRLREARELSHNKLAALADLAADSIREYELGKYRPKQPKLWGLARALDVMPVALGAGSTRGGEAPVPMEVLLRKKGGRTLRLQHLVELLTPDGRVSTFAQQTGLEPELVYAIAATESQVSEDQLEPFLAALPQVRRSWLISGEGEPLVAVSPAIAPAIAPAVAPVVTAVPSAAADAGPEGAAREVPPRAFGREPLSVFTPAPAPVALSVQPLGLSLPVQPGAPVYVPLGLGLVAEVEAVLLDGGGAISSFRLLAGAGVVPALRNEDQLERLFYALRDVLCQQQPV